MKELLRLLTVPGRIFFICAAASMLLLAGAHMFERIGGLPPCPLCLDQREVHWIALAVFLAGGAAYIGTQSQRLLGASLALMVMVYGYSTWLSGYHAGVEWKWWEGPNTCAAMASADGPVDILAEMTSETVIPCTEAAWRMFGISMAGYNALVSLVLMLLAGFGAWQIARKEGYLPVADRKASA